MTGTRASKAGRATPARMVRRRLTFRSGAAIMPRDAHSVAKAVDMLDLLIEFFDDGDRWIKGKLDDGAGNRCLVGALRDIRDGHNLYGAPTRIYLLRAMQRSPKTGWTGLISFNDRCRDFAELREVILQARKLAVGDIEKHQRAVPTNDLLAA